MTLHLLIKEYSLRIHKKITCDIKEKIFLNRKVTWVFVRIIFAILINEIILFTEKNAEQTGDSSKVRYK